MGKKLGKWAILLITLVTCSLIAGYTAYFLTHRETPAIREEPATQEPLEIYSVNYPEQVFPGTSLYPNGIVYAWGKNRDVREIYYLSWLVDRFAHGLSNTVGQYLGFDNNTIEYFLNQVPHWNATTDSEFLQAINPMV